MYQPHPSDMYLCASCGQKDPTQFYASKGRRKCKECIKTKLRDDRAIVKSVFPDQYQQRPYIPNQTYSSAPTTPVMPNIVMTRLETLNDESSTMYPHPDGITWRQYVDDGIGQVQAIEDSCKANSIIIRSLAEVSSKNEEKNKEVLAENVYFKQRISELEGNIDYLVKRIENLENLHTSNMDIMKQWMEYFNKKLFGHPISKPQ